MPIAHFKRHIRNTSIVSVMLLHSLGCQGGAAAVPALNARLHAYLAAINPHYWYPPMKQKVSTLMAQKTVDERINALTNLIENMREMFISQPTRAQQGASIHAREAYNIISQAHLAGHETENLHAVVQQWLRGHAIAQKIFKGESPPATPEAVSDVATYLYALATREVNHPLDDFTLVMIDAAQISLNTGICESPLNKLYLWFKQSASCYPRISTHFSHCKQQQFGLDLTARTSAASGAPTKKLHLLFGQLSETMFFFKLEGYGLRGARHFIMHSGGYIVSRIRKVSALRALFRVVPDDHASFRNEVPPQIIMAIFKELLMLLEQQKSQRTAIIKRVKSYGIGEMVRVMATYAADQIDARVMQLMNAFTAHLKSIYDAATLELRIGHEIICTAQQLLASEMHT
jgi:hypothetical protein